MYSDPHYKGFKKYHEKQKALQQVDKKQRKKEKKMNHNSIHSDKFLAIKNKYYYRAANIFIDFFITLLPIFILDINLWGLNDVWYFSGIIMCVFSCVDPFLCLNFIRHRLSNIRKSLYQFKFLLSFFIIVLAIILPT